MKCPYCGNETELNRCEKCKAAIKDTAKKQEPNKKVSKTKKEVK